MKKISTAAAKQKNNLQDQRLTIGLDLGDRSSWYCVLNEAGEVLLEQKTEHNRDWPMALISAAVGSAFSVAITLSLLFWLKRLSLLPKDRD